MSENIKGWLGIGKNRGQIVLAEDGFTHAAQAVGIRDFDPSAPEADEFMKMLLEWYFSGDWIEVDVNG